MNGGVAGFGGCVGTGGLGQKYPGGVLGQRPDRGLGAKPHKPDIHTHRPYLAKNEDPWADSISLYSFNFYRATPCVARS